MFKLFASGLTLLLCLGTAGLIAGNSAFKTTVEMQLAADGAFRDGLYMGRLAAQAGRPLRPMTGRWSSKHDRESFVAGFQRGYNDVLASALKE